MNLLLFIFVPGIPGTAGSKRAFPVRKGGVLTGKTIVTDAAGPKGKQWMQTVKQFAAEHYEGEPVRDAALKLTIRFQMPRPKSHFRTGKRSNELKEDAKKFHLQTPDTLKMARAVEDALTGIVWHDDCQIVDGTQTKEWSTQPGAWIEIYEIGKNP